jgi:hypothetical protein
MTRVVENTWRITPVAAHCLSEILGTKIFVRSDTIGKIIGGLGVWNAIGANRVFVAAYPKHREDNFPFERGIYICFEPQCIGNFGVNFQENDALNVRPMGSREQRAYERHGITAQLSRGLWPDDGLQLESQSPVSAIRIATADGMVEPLGKFDPGICYSYDCAVQFEFRDGTLLNLSTDLSGYGSLYGDIAVRVGPLSIREYSHIEDVALSWREVPARENSE